MRGIAGPAALLLAGIAWLAAATAQETVTRTLLVPRAASGSLDLVDPGSALRLASVQLDAPARRVTVSPDGRLAAVIACGVDGEETPTPVTLILVALEQPRVLRQVALGQLRCPQSLAWFPADRVLLFDGRGNAALAVDVETGRVDALPAASPAASPRSPVEVAAGTAAAQQFVAGGGRLRDLAATPVVPRAVCHACTPDR